MKLRNKKTGEIVELKLIQVNDKCLVDHEVDFLNGEKLTLKLLANSFDDVKEPLIKDERIRRAVRAWAEVEGETQVQVTHCRKHILSIWSVTKENGNIDFDCDIEDTFDEGFYSISQLCGEEEE